MPYTMKRLLPLALALAIALAACPLAPPAAATGSLIPEDFADYLSGLDKTDIRTPSAAVAFLKQKYEPGGQALDAEITALIQ